ncbi:MAG: DUF2480 family protein [Bacteroidota bacterium]|uniref:DUF2480 family protein n=1 Tax=Algoriphagus faecimaris TaxID=686796 RepID=A0A1G6N2H0_9BACT|nr:DUF2480 family protein [Algoriphagus faecimaris]SDC62019.1 Protein of unknown function [Algoriphagus faecimaris]
MTEIVNRVAQSPIVTINLEEFYPKEERLLFDLKPFLFQELVLREREFRESLKSYDWSVYKGKWVAIDCTVDAIIPTWAYMLVATYLTNSKGYVIGDLSQLEFYIAERCVTQIDLDRIEGAPVVIKGCSEITIPLFAYGRIVSLIQDKAKSIMFGEPCSTVPLYKKPKS